ncbi:MAG TPA: helix-turn-helix transcriptional regulator [Dactylosporangium sp.]|nr:helix-turn-helix transcriptional regulator [Dactylosporangium sp.]
MTSPAVGVQVRNGPAVAHYPPGATLGPRVLPCYEFVWMLRGHATWQCAADGGDPRSAPPLGLDPGMLLLTRPGQREYYSWDPDRPCVHAYVTFYIDGAAALGAPEGWPLTRFLSAGDPLESLCRYLLWLGGTDAPGAAERTADVLGWLLHLFVHGPFAADAGGALPVNLRPLVDHLRTIWRDGPMRPPGVAEMAAAANVSPGHLARIFRRQFGTGPVAAVEAVRLARAAMLLQRSNLSVGAIAEACGFANPFHFSRRFRAAYGLPPRAYREVRPGEPLEPVRRAGLLALAQPLLGENQ